MFLMNQLNTNQFKSISDLPRKYVEILEDANEFGYVYILKNNRHVGGVVGTNLLQKLKDEARREILQEIEEARILKNVERGMKEYREGKAKTLKSFKDLI